MTDNIEILKPRKKNGVVTAWAPRALIEQHMTFGNWPSNRSFFSGIPGIKMTVDATSGLTIQAPSNGDPCAVATAMKSAFHQLGLLTRISPC